MKNNFIEFAQTGIAISWIDLLISLLVAVLLGALLVSIYRIDVHPLNRTKSCVTKVKLKGVLNETKEIHYGTDYCQAKGSRS